MKLTSKFKTMKTTTQYIECFRKIDKNGRFYYTEKWTDTDFEDCRVVAERVVFKGRCSKQDFERRMQTTKFLRKTENCIIFEN